MTTTSKPILYFVHFENTNTFHLCSQKFDDDSDFWEKNNIELTAIDFKMPGIAFNVLSNIFAQAGIVLLKD